RVARTPAEALAICRTSPVDCVFCDLMMPGLGGADLYRALEGDGGGVERRVVFMAGGAYTPEARAFLPSTPDPVIQKPFAARVLEEVLDAVLRTQDPQGA